MKRIILAVLLALLILVMPVHSESLDFSIIITADDASLRVNSDARCFTNATRTMYEQHVRTVRSATLAYESTGLFDSTNNMSVSTNFSAVHNPACAISGVFFAENIAIGNDPRYDNCSTCASGIYADSGVSDITLASIGATTGTTLTHGYVMQTHSVVKGTVKAGVRKRTENLTTEIIHSVHARNSTIAGLVNCQVYPAGPVTDKKPSYCVWQGDGVGYPIFNGNGNGDSNSNTTKSSYHTKTRK